jgi:hypothetical protein
VSVPADRDPEEEALAAYGFARVLIDRPAGQLLAAMSEEGAWMVRIRRDGTEPWRLACIGDVDSRSRPTSRVRPVTGSSSAT